MSHVGFFCFLGTGHLYPAIALARRLKTRNHQVTVFHLNAARAAICAAGLNFCSIEDLDLAPVSGGNSSSSSKSQPSLFAAMAVNAGRILRNAPRVIKETGVDALIVDQSDLAAGSVADFLGLPFLTLSTSPPSYLDDDVPPPYFQWQSRRGPFARLRNHLGNAFVTRAVAPVVAIVNKQRKIWGLKEFRHINEFFSNLGTVTQLPEVLDFRRIRRPSSLLYAGPLLDPQARSRTGFPWQELNGMPLVYASMGTLLNDKPDVFRMIAAACSSFEVQLVLSLGGGTLFPDELRALPGRSIVVHYAPQLEILKRASLTITHSGLNTTLESLYEGVPLVAIPVNNDQPGIAARVEWAGVGRVVPFRKLSVGTLQKTIAKVLTDGKYRLAASRIKMELRKNDPVESACDFIEQALSIRVSSCSSGHSVPLAHCPKDSNHAENVRLRC